MHTIAFVIVALVAGILIGTEIGYRYGFQDGRWEDVSKEEFATLVYDHERGAQ